MRTIFIKNINVVLNCIVVTTFQVFSVSQCDQSTILKYFSMANTLCVRHYKTWQGGYSLVLVSSSEALLSSPSFNKISSMCRCTELHYGHCPAIVIPSAESAIGRLKGGFTELLAWVDMVSDEEAVGRCCHGRTDV